MLGALGTGGGTVRTKSQGAFLAHSTVAAALGFKLFPNSAAEAGVSFPPIIHHGTLRKSFGTDFQRSPRQLAATSFHHPLVGSLGYLGI